LRLGNFASEVRKAEKITASYSVRVGIISPYLSFRGDDFQPISVGVLNKIEAHPSVFIAYAAHFFMEFMRRGYVVGYKGDMRFVVAELVRALFFAEPRQLNLMRGRAAGICDKRELKTSVGGFMPADYFHPEGFLVKCERFFEVGYVYVTVRQSKIHDIFLP